jgi:hypothetical protein
MTCEIVTPLHVPPHIIILISGTLQNIAEILTKMEANHGTISGEVVQTMYSTENNQYPQCYC